jgi:hypothetical protein
MKNEVLPLLKSIGVVVVGVLIANYVQKTLMMKNTSAPATAPNA